MSTTYTPPTIGSAGLTIPSYNAILNYLLGAYTSIYGSNIYLGPDSSDFQWISTIALALSANAQGLQYIYNNRGPATAIGSGLDGVVKLNGLARLPATYSSVELTLTGVAGTIITNGVVQDSNGFLWNLESPIVLTTSPVIATAQQAGSINANPGSITQITTQVAGWTGVTNVAAAIPGTAVEMDSALRARQAISVALPSETRLAGTISGLLQTPGVTRVNVIENYTAVTDPVTGLPPHSIDAVVEGGNDLAVATAIFNNRGIGPYTYATPFAPADGVPVTDPNTGFLTFIQFNRPLYVDVYVTANIHGLTGFTSATLSAIQSDLISYLNALTIGESIIWGECIAACLNARSNPDNPSFSVKSLYLGVAPSPTGTSDIPLAFYQVSQGIQANIIINSV